jgi:hypothetical protein
MRSRLSFFLFFFIDIILIGQDYSNYKSQEVGIVEFYRKGYTLSFPATELYSSDLLELRFDIFSVDREVLLYKVELCDYNWTTVEVSPFDYIEGFQENTLAPYSISINTTVEYVHYRLQLPNDDLNILMPGNYIITVFRQEEPDHPLLKRRFIVYEDLAAISLKMDQLKSESSQIDQELNASVSTENVSLNEMAGNIRLMILQNNNWASAQYFDRYNTSYGGNIEFNTPGQIVFNGLNEFRFFDMKSFKFISERVLRNEYRAPNYHVILKDDQLRGDKEYFYKEDLNGLFYIDNTDTDDEDILDADYAWVHFTLDTEVPLPADIYIEGALTDWGFKDNYLEFNPEKGVYEKQLLLKQGLYNYRYVLKEYSSNKNSYFLTEGEHYQTCNNYLAVLYYRKLGEIYYAPIGVASVAVN